MVPSFFPVAILRPFLVVEHHFPRPHQKWGLDGAWGVRGAALRVNLPLCMRLYVMILKISEEYSFFTAEGVLAVLIISTAVLCTAERSLQEHNVEHAECQRPSPKLTHDGPLLTPQCQADRCAPRHFRHGGPACARPQRARSAAQILDAAMGAGRKHATDMTACTDQQRQPMQPT